LFLVNNEPDAGFFSVIFIQPFTPDVLIFGVEGLYAIFQFQKYCEILSELKLFAFFLHLL
jgi:hypothetical protein